MSRNANTVYYLKKMCYNTKKEFAMIKKFFNKKRIVFCFIAYILITAFILSQSLLSSEQSTQSSNFVGTTISKIISFITGDKIDLENDDKTEGLYPQSITLTGVPARLVIGKTYALHATLNPLGDYPLSKLSYSSSNQNVLKVNSKGEITPVSSGSATVTVTDTLSKVSSSKSFFVTNEVYTPTITFLGVAGDQNVDANGYVYYSPSTSTGIMYVLGYQSDLESINATVVEGEADILLTTSKVWFVTKKVGTLKIKLYGNYKNSNGDQTIEQTYEINVREGTFNPYTCNFTFVNPPETLELELGESASVLTNSSNYFEGVEDVQKALYPAYNKNIIGVTASNQSLILTAKQAGETTLNVYSAGTNGLTVTSLNVVVKKPHPTTAQIVTPSTYIKNGVATRITVIGDGVTYSASEFNWTVEGTSDYSFSGENVTVNENGTITLKGEHKTISGFTVERVIEVKNSYSQNVRKIVGHFLLFLTLSLFAYWVYKRLAELTTPKKAVVFTVVFTLVAGLLTAGVSELLQLEVFSFQRGASFIDVLIDFGGFLLGTAICFIIDIIKRKRAK